MAVTQLTVEFGLIKDYPETTITYNGSGETGVTIVIEAFGAASGIRINNTTRSETMILDNDRIKSITGAGLSKDDEIRINTTKGSKSATLTRDGISYNILHALDKSSKWIYLQAGTNKFTSTATSGLENIRVHLEYVERYLGI